MTPWNDPDGRRRHRCRLPSDGWRAKEEHRNRQDHQHADGAQNKFQMAQNTVQFEPSKPRKSGGEATILAGNG
jgi:hypothetical protein